MDTVYRWTQKKVVAPFQRVFSLDDAIHVDTRDMRFHACLTEKSLFFPLYFQDFCNVLLYCQVLWQGWPVDQQNKHPTNFHHPKTSQNQGSTQSPLDVAGVILQSPLESAFNEEKKTLSCERMWKVYFFFLNVLRGFTLPLPWEMISFDRHYFFLKWVVKNHFPLTTLRIGSPQRKVVFQPTIFKTQIEKSHNLSELRGRNASTSKTMRFWEKNGGNHFVLTWGIILPT